MNTLTHLFDWLLAASLRASLLTLATLLIQVALHRHLGARMRYALWLPLLIVLLTPVLPESRWSIEHVFQPATQPAPTASAVISPVVTEEPAPVVFAAEAPMPEPIDWQRIFLLTWAGISTGMLALGGISFGLTLRRFKQARHPAGDELVATLTQIAREIGLRHVPRILIASTVRSPAVTGLLRPTLLLPAEFDREFTPAEARLVLKHELMHLKRGDLPLNAVMCVLMALHWFNPLLWIAFFRIRADREAACDAQVLHDASGDRRVEYGHALLKVETAFCQRGFSLGFVGIFQRGAALRSRIRSIAAHRAPHPAMKVLITLCIVLMTFLGITRAQQPKPAGDAPLIAIEMKIIKFDKPTDWNFDGRLPAQEDPSSFPPPIILSPADLATCLTELTKKEASITSYPRLVTASGKEVVLKSIVNQPTKGSDGKVVYLPIGLVCKLTPAAKDEVIHLDVDITDSSLIDPATGATISGSEGEHFTARSRVYKSSLETRDGQSWVIASWDEGKPQSKRPELYIITSHVIDPKQGGLPAGINLTSDFAVGKSAFRPGDSIHITSMTRSDDMLIVGLDYELNSTDEATAALYLTPTDKTGGGKPPPFDARQQAVVKRGRGSLVLHHPLPAQGLPHVTFYDTKTHDPIGAAYFGTTAEAARSQAFDLSYMTASVQPQPTEPAAVIKSKLEKIIIPSVQFQGASVEEALDFFRVKSRELDTISPDPASRGVSILYRAGSLPSSAAISLDFKDIPLGEALRYTAELAGLKISIQPYAVVIGESLPAPAAGAAASAPPAEVPSPRIILPSIEFREATLAECIEFIRARSRELDPEKKGLNIIVKPGGDASTRITLSLKDVPVYEALRYCAELSNHKLTTDARAYFLTPVLAEPKGLTLAPPADPAALKAAELRRAKARQYDFAKAMLGDVLRFLATDAGLNFFSLPEDNPVNQRLVTFSIHASPFEVLETLCRANNLVLVLDHERWLIRPGDDDAQIGKIYALPQTQVSVETILKDISAVLGEAETKAAANAPKPSVAFQKEQNAVSVRATRLQHSWVSAYFQGLASSAKAGATK